MKKILTASVLALLFVFAFSFESCQKCTTCYYTYTGPQGQSLTYEYPEVCGNKDDIEALEDLCDNESAAVNGDCFCD